MMKRFFDFLFAVASLFLITLFTFLAAHYAAQFFGIHSEILEKGSEWMGGLRKMNGIFNIIVSVGIAVLAFLTVRKTYRYFK